MLGHGTLCKHYLSYPIHYAKLQITFTLELRRGEAIPVIRRSQCRSSYRLWSFFMSKSMLWVDATPVLWCCILNRWDCRHVTLSSRILPVRNMSGPWIQNEQMAPSHALFWGRGEHSSHSLHLSAVIIYNYRSLSVFICRCMIKFKSSYFYV